MTPLKRVAGLSKYLSKYLSKQFDENENFNKKRYWSSKHKLPDVVRVILRGADLMTCLYELSGFLGLSFTSLVMNKGNVFIPSSNDMAWFNYTEDLGLNL
jgi:hypothetical protein